MSHSEFRLYALAMVTTAASSSSSFGDLPALLFSLAALLVSLLAVLVPAATGRQQRLRDDREKRSEMYLELMELIEGHGLWVVDRTYDLLETSHGDFGMEMPHRRTDQPDRVARVRARAIVSAYASTSVSDAFTQWQRALESFEQKLDVFAFIAHEEGEASVDARQAEPLRDAEITARKQVGDAVNAQLVQDRRWRRNTPSPVRSLRLNELNEITRV